MQKLIYILYERLTSVNIDTLSVGGGVVLGPVIVFVEKYIYEDWSFGGMLMIVVGIDTMLGYYKAHRLNDVSSSSWAKLFTKVMVYFALLVCAHTAAKMKVHGKPDILLTWVDSVIYAAIFMREFLSIVEKAGALGVALPKWLLKRLRDFDENGKYIDTPK